MSLLLDLWKRGLQDCFNDDITVEEAALEKHIASREPPYEEKELQECQQYIKWAEKISQEVGHEVPWEFRRWKEMLDDIDAAPMLEGSLYRCGKCLSGPAASGGRFDEAVCASGRRSVLLGMPKMRRRI